MKSIIAALSMSILMFSGNVFAKKTTLAVKTFSSQGIQFYVTYEGKINQCTAFEEPIAQKAKRTSCSSSFLKCLHLKNNRSLLSCAKSVRARCQKKYPVSPIRVEMGVCKQILRKKK
jgi:hypothetical protein